MAESRLVIVIDSVNALRNTERLNTELSTLNQRGNTANTSINRLEITINNFSNELRDTNGAITQTSGGLAKLGAAAAGLTAIMAGFGLASGSSAKELVNFARIADVSVVEFQKMAVAASDYGISADTLASQMKDFNEKIGEFLLLGSGGAFDAFEFLAKNTKMTAKEVGDLSVKIQNASGKDGLLMYVNALEKAGASTEQMSFFLESVGSDLTFLIPILKNNGKELEALGKEAERLGVILSEDAVAQALELEKQMKLLKMQLQGAKNEMMQGFVPALSQVAKALNQGSSQSDLMRQAGEDLGQTLKVVTSIAMGAYVAISTVSRAVIGLAQDAIKAYNTINTTKDGGGFIANLPGVKLIRAAFTAPVVASMPDSNLSNAMDKNAKQAENYANFIYTVFEETVKKANKSLSELGETQTGELKTPGVDKFIEDMNKEDEAAAAKTKANAAKTANEIANIREQIFYKYTSREKQIEFDLQKELADIRKAGMGKELIELATSVALAEKELYKAQMDFEINEYKLTEKEKIKARLGIAVLEAAADKQLTKEQRQEKIKSLEEISKRELRAINIAKEERMTRMSEQFLSEEQAMNRRYDLEMKRILEINDKHEKDFSLRMLQLKRDEEVKQRINQARSTLDDVYADMGVSTSTEAQRAYFKRQKASQGLFDAQMTQANIEARDPNADLKQIAKMREQIWFEHNKRMNDIESQFKADSLAANLDYSSGVASALSGLVDETSSTYSALFAIQKSFNLASAIMSSKTAILEAWKSNSFPYNLPAVAAVTLETGILTSAIQAVSPRGFRTGGYTGDMGLNDVAGVVHGQEYVLNAQATKRIGVDTLNAVNSGASLQQSQKIDNNVKVIMVRDENEAKDMLYSADGEKAFLYHMKRNRAKI